ncbi:hypothetical protein [Paenibacillus sanfengchensis]|uniref:hypothetical protein n=1 Tax=Paenibacillus sanfengchensis TaxID=3119819 RepID=UPI002FE3BB72
MLKKRRRKRASGAASSLILAALMLSACSENTDSPTENTAFEANSSQPSQTGLQKNKPDQEIQSPSRLPEAEQDRIADDFEALLKQGGTLKEAFDSLGQYTGKMSGERMSTMLLAFEDAQREALGPLTDRYYEGNRQEMLNQVIEEGDTLEELIGKVQDDSLKTLLTETREGKFVLDWTEGMFSPTPDYTALAAFGSQAGDDTAAYLKLMAQETVQPTSRDAGLTITWEELLNRSLALEKLTTKYPDFKWTEDLETKLDYYKRTLMYGLDNTPLFGFETSVMEPEARQAYEAALAEGDVEASPLLQNLRAFMDEAAKEEYKLNESLEELRSKLTSADS